MVEIEGREIPHSDIRRRLVSGYFGALTFHEALQFAQDTKTITSTGCVLAELAQGYDFLSPVQKSKFDSVLVENDLTKERIYVTNPAAIWNNPNNSSEDFEILMEEVYQKRAEFYPDDSWDKLDRIEMAMVLEDAIISGINQGYFTEAKQLLIDYKKLNSKEESMEEHILEIEFIGQSYGRIAIAQIQAGLSEGEMQKLSPFEITSFLQSADHQAIEALGYFGLIGDVQKAGLKPEVMASVMIGQARATQSLSTESIAQVGLVYQQDPDKNVARAVVEGFRAIPDDKVLFQLYEMLDNELAGRQDPVILARIAKGLIELRDKRGKDVATELFLNEQFPPHLRIYLARKLCDSGHWDRQIITYFRGYKSSGAIRQGGSDILVQIDSLAAIINQMHMSPSLALYKVFEQTRIKKDRESLDKIALFGNEVFLIPDLDVEKKLEIFSFWISQHEDNKITLEQLRSLTGKIRTIIDSQQVYCRKNKIDSKNIPYSLKKILQTLYTSLHLFQNSDEINTLLQRGVFPTSSLIELVQAEKGKALKTIASLQRETKEGKFNPDNLPQRDLEFTRFLMLASPKPAQAVEDFTNLEMILPGQKKGFELSFREKMEAEAASYEAAQLYWFLRKRTEMGRKLTVIGNQRYGDYFVTAPLRPFLQELGVLVSFFKIGSSEISRQSVFDIFPDSFIQHLVSGSRDVVIVDGSRNSRSANGSSRLPSAMIGYRNWFLAFNEAVGIQTEQQFSPEDRSRYRSLVDKIRSFDPQKPFTMTHWVPVPTTMIEIGKLTQYEEPQSQGGPYVTFANPCLHPNLDQNFPPLLKNHQPGYLDNPDQFTSQQILPIIFTPRGIEQTSVNRGTEAEFVREIQSHMSKLLPDYIRQTDSIFR